MKVFKLWKSVRGGNTTPVYRVYDSKYWGEGEDCEEEWARHWAENDSSGSEYGYTAYWDEVTDENIIKEKIDELISYKEHSIESLKDDINELKSFRNKYRKEKLEKLNNDF
jgi:hypothetical protein